MLFVWDLNEYDKKYHIIYPFQLLNLITVHSFEVLSPVVRQICPEIFFSLGARRGGSGLQNALHGPLPSGSTGNGRARGFAQQMERCTSQFESSRPHWFGFKGDLTGKPVAWVLLRYFLGGKNSQQKEEVLEHLANDLDISDYLDDVAFDRDLQHITSHDSLLDELRSWHSHSRTLKRGAMANWTQ